ncbi:hypothetical protein [uncultured Oxalicibacterium sp.]|uniref:hypothetical protein n=1 Tax=uncultured Oxalicibacterium sp. TaxID=1168540 RepID=UPI0025F50C35|nr:hypothetical protein [uncultured Oxalicibacterium sp.]
MPLMPLFRLVICCALAFATWSAHAFERPFPPSAKRGVMTPGMYPEITLDSKARRLSAGSRIWNRDNLIQMPASLPSTQMTVHYTEDIEGNIDRVWILTDEEIKKPAPKPATETTE